MERPTCKTCVFWRELEVELDDRPGYGLCCHNSPKTRKHHGCGNPDCDDHEFFIQWPTTLSTEGCGDHHLFPEFIEYVKKTPGWRELELVEDGVEP